MRKKTLFTLVAGTTLGIAGGLLLAPSPGKDARSVFSYHLKKILEKLYKYLKHRLKYQEPLLNDIKKEQKDRIKSLDEKAKHLLVEVSNLIKKK